MLISYDRRFLFVHVPKTGGSSVRVALGRYAHDATQYRVNQLARRLGIRLNHLALDHRKRYFRTHERASVIKRCLPTELFDAFFKFAFVRNPWSLLVSQYKFIRQNASHRRHRVVRSMSFPRVR